MKIKSNFKDYYDYALSGIALPDDTLSYFRDLKIVKYDSEFSLKTPFNVYGDKKNDSGCYENFFFVYLCGKVYKGIQKVNFKKTEWGNNTFVNDVYSYIDFTSKEEESDVLKQMKLIAENNPIVVLKVISNVTETVPDRNYDWRDGKKAEREALLFKEQNKKVIMQNNLTYDKKYVINDSLKNVSFNKIMDATIVYQEIETFLNHINSDEKVIEFPDVLKRDSHGFDKYSFKNKSVKS